MDTPQVNRKQIDDLRAWFFAKDRSISLAQSCLYYLTAGGRANAAYMSLAFITETVLSASVASVTFNNIPQDFRHLMVITQARTDTAAEIDAIQFRLNNDSGSNYDRLSTVIVTTGVAAVATRGAIAAANAVITEGANSRAFNFSPGLTIIFGYSVNTQEKHILSLSSSFGDLSADTDLNLRFNGIHWRNRNVITNMLLLPGSAANFVSGSRFQIFGML